MSRRTIKKLLLSLIVVGALGSFTARGTFAVLNGETANSNNALATGTLKATETWLSATGSGDLTCNSQDASLNLNTGCFTIQSDTTQMFPIASASGGALPSANTYESAHISIQNTGTLPATLYVYMPSATYATTTGTATNTTLTAVNPTCPGTASGVVPVSPNPTCTAGGIDLFIQETNAPTGSPRTYTNLSSCVWPASTSTACTFQDNSFEQFWSNYNPQTSALSLGSIAAGATRYFQVAVAEPQNAALGLEGQTATFALYWYLQ